MDQNSPKSSADKCAPLTRRGFVRATLSGSAVMAGAAVAACAPGMLGRPRPTKQDAAYQDHPRGQQRCAGCIHFMPPNQCSVVAGDISPNGWSRYYMAKA